MSVPPLLVLQSKGISGSPRVFRLLNGTTLVPLGPALPGSYEAPANYVSNPNARVIRFGDKIYVSNEDKIYRLDEGDNPTEGDDTWTAVHTLGMKLNNGKTQHTGIHIVQIRNTPYMAIAYLDNTSTKLKTATSSDGTTWIESGDLSASAIAVSQQFGRSIVWRNKIYWVIAGTTNNVNVAEINIEIGVAIHHETNTINCVNTGGDLCVFDDRLWLIHAKLLNNEEISLFEFTGAGGLNEVFEIATTNVPLVTQNVSVQSGQVLFTDGTDMFAIITGDNVSQQIGNYCFRMQLSSGSGSTLTLSEVTSTVLPTNFLSGTSTSATPAAHRWFSFLDNTNPQNIQVHLWVLSTDILGIGSYSYALWNGPNSPMGDMKPGPGAGLVLPCTKDGGGERIWTSASPNIEIISKSPAKDGVLFGFKVSGIVGTEVKRARFIYGRDEEFSELFATIRPTSILGGAATWGTDSVSDLIDDLDPDGVTTYYFVWETVIDGVTNDNVVLTPKIETV